MNHFCVMNADRDIHFYQCLEAQCQTCSRYQAGAIAPRFPVPAVPIKTGYMPWSWEQPYPSAYWYIASRTLLWSIFKRWGFIEERA